MRTYTDAYGLIATRDVSKADFVVLCEKLSEALGVAIRPEGVSEGGLVWENVKYKSVRFSGNPTSWPWVGPDVMTDWKTSSDILFKERTTIPNLFLKSLHGAPLFTLDELEIMEFVFDGIGLRRIGRYPKAKDLQS